MIRANPFWQFNEQPFLDIVDTVYTVAPKVDTAHYDQKDPAIERHSDISWINPSEETYSIFEKISQGVMHANKKAEWFFDAPIIEPLQFTQYKVGQKYDWHVDQFMGIEDTIRKISFSILLNDDFEGGELQIEAGSPEIPDERIETVKLKKGDALIFPSYTWHRVLPVTSGVRHSLVGWCRGDQWK